ncbi:MAG: isoprenylcysteine carboxylmethyltransferase family protein, partial [Hyphomicrobium sp.]
MPDEQANNNPIVDDRPSETPWPPIILVGVVTAAILLGYVAPLPWPGLNDAPARMIGLGIGAAGVVLIIWAVLTLRSHGTTFLPDAGATHLVPSGP